MNDITNSQIIELFPSAFFDAVKRYDHESLSYFFHNTSNEQAKSYRNEKGESALHIAVKAGHCSKYKLILFINRSSERIT